jgi:hypothetical protein
MAVDTQDERVAGEEETAADAETIDAMNGKSIDERAAEENDEVDEEDVQMQFPGTQSSLTLNAGGARPTSALAKISAISLPMPPQQQMTGEEEVIVSLRCKVNVVAFRALKKGGKQREHTLTPVELIEVRPATEA